MISEEKLKKKSTQPGLDLNSNNPQTLKQTRRPIINGIPPPSINQPINPPIDPRTNILKRQTEELKIEQAQKMILQNAYSKTYGNYVGKMSNFENLIVPVLPSPSRGRDL